MLYNAISQPELTLHRCSTVDLLGYRLPLAYCLGDVTTGFPHCFTFTTVSSCKLVNNGGCCMVVAESADHANRSISRPS